MQKQDKGKSHTPSLANGPESRSGSHSQGPVELMEAEGTDGMGIQPQKGCSQSLALRREEEEWNGLLEAD